MSEHELWNELGNLYFTSGSYTQAIHAYTRSIALDRNYGRPYSNMALAYVQKGKYLEAIDLYQAGIRLLKDDQERAWTWYRLGNVYRQLKDYRRAVDAYQRADEIDPNARELEHSTNKADALLNRKPTLEDTFRMTSEPAVVESKAVPSYEPAPVFIAETIAPAPAPVAEVKPVIVIMEEDPMPASSPTPEPAPLLEELTPWSFDEQVVPDAEEFPELEPWAMDDADDVVAGETVVFTEPLKWETASVAQSTAEEVFAEAETIAPIQAEPSAAAVAMISSEPVQQLMQEQQRVEVAVAAVEEKPATEVIVISEDHSTTEAPEFIEETVTSPEAVQYQVPEVEELPAFEVSPAELARLKIDIDKYKRILELNPTNPLAWDKIGGLYKASGLYDEAIAAYRKAISIDSSKSVYFYHLGLVYAAERKLEDAIFAFQKVIEIEPNYSLAHATLGGYYRRMGQEELAKVHIDKALSSIGDDENEYNRACMEAICGNTDRAFELLEIALKNKQTNVEWVRRDPDLDFVRSDPRFNTLLLEYATRPTP